MEEEGSFGKVWGIHSLPRAQRRSFTLNLARGKRPWEKRLCRPERGGKSTLAEGKVVSRRGGRYAEKRRRCEKERKKRGLPFGKGRDRAGEWFGGKKGDALYPASRKRGKSAQWEEGARRRPRRL